tara:strand:+ start:10321 stop:10917 length:597 start_codon:yes stop_codon:yes gene_type:complete
MDFEPKKESSLIKSLIKYFLQGLFYTVPIAATIYVIVYAVILIDGIINMAIPGLGMIVILGAVTLIGFLGTHFFINYFKPFERAIENTPLIKIIYTSMKDMMNAFVGKKKQFKQAVLVKMGGGVEVERLGFITKDDLSEIGISEDKVAVYIPFSYAISGQVLIVPKQNITLLDAPSSDVMKMIISGGVTSVEKHKNHK